MRPPLREHTGNGGTSGELLAEKLIRPKDQAPRRGFDLFRVYGRLGYLVQTPGSRLNRDWRGADCLPSFRKSNFGELSTRPRLPQEGAQKHQHKEDRSAANTRECNVPDHSTSKSKAMAKIEEAGQLAELTEK